jgi:adenylate kinase
MRTVVSITGTPGTGKTTVAGLLRDKGYDVIDLTAYIKEHGLLDEYDADMGSYDVDTTRLAEALDRDLKTEGLVFIEGHLAHFVPSDIVIVLRCHPAVLNERLSSRGYAPAKVLENVQAEVLDVILCESSEAGVPVYELDSTSSDACQVAEAIEGIIRGEEDRHLPGSVSWGEEMDRWF